MEIFFKKKKATQEDIVKMKEAQLELDPSEGSRAELRREEVELRRLHKIVEDYWEQKTEIVWFKEGDKNTKFFHAYVKGRRKRLWI